MHAGPQNFERVSRGRPQGTKHVGRAQLAQVAQATPKPHPRPGPALRPGLARPVMATFFIAISIEMHAEAF